MNEPHRGYVDLQSMHGFDYNTDLHLGPVRTCFVYMAVRESHILLQRLLFSRSPWVLDTRHRSDSGHVLSPRPPEKHHLWFSTKMGGRYGVKM